MGNLRGGIIEGISRGTHESDQAAVGKQEWWVVRGPRGRHLGEPTLRAPWGMAEYWGVSSCLPALQPTPLRIP